MSASTPAVVACDLDRTLIYSRRAMRLGPEPFRPVCVERSAGRAVSFVTAAAAASLAGLAARVPFVAVTTRSHAQFARFDLPVPAPRWSVAANGGLLYQDGVIDRSWSARVRARLATGLPLAQVRRHAEQVCAPGWTVAVRDVDDLFCCAVVHPNRLPEGLLPVIASWASERGWRTSLQGRKLYWIPEALSKADAVAEIARRAGAERVIAAGDSLLDEDLLVAADAAIHPAHGELFERGWAAPGVERTRSRGLAAGEEIVRWFADQVS